jgi:oxygen-dependent protoporphyrinogen oxidase
MLLVRCSVGRGHSQQVLGLDDASLLTRVTEELRDAIGVTGDPLASAVTRWEQALPQYNVGHLERMERIDGALAGHPELAIAGGGYRGMGVPACIAQGRSVARQVAAALASNSQLSARA